jgi:6-phosphogluconolactonase
MSEQPSKKLACLAERSRKWGRERKMRERLERGGVLGLDAVMRFLFAFVVAIAVASAAAAEKTLVFIGTYTQGQSKGIYSYELNLQDGSLHQIGVAAQTPNPSFLAIHPNKKFLYSVNEVEMFQGKKAGAVTGFQIDATAGKLEKINEATSGGPGPCHLSVDKSGKFVLVANYSGGSVEVLPINDQGELGAPTSFIQHTGSSVNKERQGEPHAHSINLDAHNRFAITADLGLDKLFVYRFDSQKGTLSPNDPPFTRLAPGSGPRHFAFAPNGKNAYGINEIASTATAFSWDGDHGTLTELGTVSTLPNGPVPGNSTAEIQVHPSGKFVYGSNRGDNSIAVFSVEASGKLKLIANESTRGKTPRNFGIDPTGRYLIAANQDSDTLAVFKIDQKAGTLTAVGETVAAPKPVCVKFLLR